MKGHLPGVGHYKKLEDGYKMLSKPSRPRLSYSLRK
jgi:hypothetical protein